MPWTCHVDREHDLVVGRVVGELTHDEILEFFDEIAAHPDFHPEMRHFIDARHGSVNARFTEARMYAQLDPFSRDARRAVVVGDALQYGLARMYQGILGSQDQGPKPFQTMEDAARWLGIDRTVLESLAAAR